MKRLQITIEYPDEVELEEIKEYAHAALSCWGGQYHPEDPLFGGAVIADKLFMKGVKDA